MPRICTVCSHPQIEAINKALLAGEPNRRIATRENVTEAALRRHKAAGHIAEHLSQAHDAQDVAQADDLLAQLRGLQTEAHRIKDKAENSKDFKTALSGIGQLVKIIELMAKLRGELDERATVNVILSPQWVTLRSSILVALAPYPDARRAVVEALADVSA